MSTSDQIASAESTIARIKAEIAQVKRDRKAFERGLTGSGYRDEREYSAHNAIVGKQQGLERSLRLSREALAAWRRAAKKR
jgi:hypothetical protein